MCTAIDQKIHLRTKQYQTVKKSMSISTVDLVKNFKNFHRNLLEGFGQSEEIGIDQYCQTVKKEKEAGSLVILKRFKNPMIFIVLLYCMIICVVCECTDVCVSV